MEQHDVNMCLAIKAAVTESIENMVFMAIDTDLDGLSEDLGSDAVMASLRVLEPRPGVLRLAMPRSTAVEISKNLYSIAENELTDAMIQDVTCELLNTISGRVMKRILPAECTFHLGLPEMVDKPHDLQGAFVQCSFLADGNLLIVLAQI
ncbi:MAG: chemotaxis protein CheX [Deltaproteobacteria bacterium]|nr:chemotaxis protein CheX [Deltaproteobacteria bacterium]